MWWHERNLRTNENHLGVGKQLPNIVRSRRAGHADILKLDQLMRKETYDMFGDISPGMIYEKACISLVQENESNDVISGICLCNYPRIPVIHPSDWPSWIHRHYGLKEVSERNAMFVHLLVWNELYTETFLEPLLKAIFSNSTYCLYVILVCPPRLRPENTIEKYAMKIMPYKERDSCNKQTLYMWFRERFSSKFSIRRAVEEDNDDVVAIIEEDTKRLTECYGEFYISEMLRYPDEQRQIIVSECNDRVTGIMCLNKSVNVELLNEHFELQSYSGLRKVHVDDHNIRDFDDDAQTGESTFRLSSHLTDKEHSLNESDYSSNCANKEVPDLEDSKKSCTSCSSFPSSQSGIILESAEVEEARLENSLSQVSLLSERHKINACLPVDEEKHEKKIIKHYKVTDNIDIEMFQGIQNKCNDLLDQHFSSYSIKAESDVHLIDTPELHLLKFDCTKMPVTPRSGKLNAFAVELFSVLKDVNACQEKDFLQTAFECFPDLDYCIMLIPSMQQFFPFLINFVRVPLRPNKDFPMVLYMTHRAVFQEQFKSRKAVPYDIDEINVFLAGINMKEVILTDVTEAITSKESDKCCCVFLWSNKIIGICVLSAEKEVDFLRRHYHIEDFISMQNVGVCAYGVLLHFIVTPIFTSYFRFFIREVMRHSTMTVLYYRLYESDVNLLTRKRPFISCIHTMMPVNPRPRMDYSLQHYFEMNAEPQAVCRQEERFALFIITPQLAMIPRPAINAKIVVVGSSDCGLAFAEYLALGCRSTCNVAYFTNITIISQNGLPYEEKRSAMEKRVISFNGRYCYDYTCTTAIRSWINIVKGTMIAINRKQKYVVVENVGTLTYDYLILTCGLQVQIPKLTQNCNSEEENNNTHNDLPYNYMSLNDDTSASDNIRKIRQLTKDFTLQKNIIFYGHNIACYCALNAFLEMGLKGTWITLIKPITSKFVRHDDAFFNVKEVNDAVTSAIAAKDVTVYSGWNVIDWQVKNCSKKGQTIKKLTISSHLNIKTIECDALINFHHKRISLKTFMAISRAGLVFDGQLVIDSNFRTNDPYIFAAGTLTKYSKKYYADSQAQQYYNSLEVGRRLAQRLKEIIEDYSANEECRITSDKQHTLLPVFREPIIISCVLPCGYYYLHVGKPGKRTWNNIPLEYGEVLATGSCDSNAGYFRLHFNQYNTIETITCLSKQSFEIQNMIALYGKHNSMLNNVKIRFRESLISDFYTYFREPWAVAIFYDRFDCLRVENRKALLSKECNPCIIAYVLEILKRSNWKSVSEKDWQLIQYNFEFSSCRQDIEKCLINFLQTFKDDLFTYAIPQMIRKIIQSDEE